jgi:hypothetical protein
VRERTVAESRFGELSLDRVVRAAVAPNARESDQLAR